MPKPFSIYIHYPFCQKRCHYCSFYSIESASTETIKAYPRQILQEFALRNQDWRGLALKSVYLGGGTPSLMEPSGVEEILHTLHQEYPPAESLEITIEANPGTVDVVKLQEFADAGVNRLSLGIQALNDRRLQFLGRIHDQEQAMESLQAARNIPGMKLSVDLIAGTPFESIESWDVELDQLLQYEPDGISFYNLTVDEGTHLANLAGSGERVSLTTDETVDLLIHVTKRLHDAGYIHYEVSNWAKPGSECRHNQHYWQRGAYLGLGPSAHSFDGSTRMWNLPDINRYCEMLDAGNLPPSDSETLSGEEVRAEWVYLKLRQSRGLDYAEYEELFGEAPHYWKVMFEKITERGLGEFDGRSFRPNDRGLLLADEISARILG
ncbi:hypothetical protein CEE37_03400 [candidate division LCP-89 bacterium B3_LCP]|uniref:Heme chaperone HemW n=1 Tax=candidate division LCP-89 bacterium B3_LCP TaxID=2012998 RepID=A0A532V362_UNCL8|nr:MAG: hypothetical protein CEE37_03400 [candidate division LCP-89 bacterium B3_LCP]